VNGRARKRKRGVEGRGAATAKNSSRSDSKDKSDSCKQPGAREERQDWTIVTNEHEKGNRICLTRQQAETLNTDKK